eukprot:1157817-Pelagomonas_calceolata.AAC.13
MDIHMDAYAYASIMSMTDQHSVMITILIGVLKQWPSHELLRGLYFPTGYAVSLFSQLIYLSVRTQ